MTTTAPRPELVDALGVDEDLLNPCPGRTVRDYHREDTRPVPAILRERSLRPDQLRTEPFSKESYLSAIDQDMNNMVRLQKGLKCRGTTSVNLARYQEAPIRAFHDCLTSYVGGS